MAWEITDDEINVACENEFDGQDSFLLVQEILEARKTIDQLQAENDKIKQQLKEGHHCQSFGMCGEAHNEYEKKVKQLQADLDKAKAENEKLKAEKRRLRSGLGILIQNWISVQKISDENYTEESDVILSNAKQALSGQEGS